VNGVEFGMFQAGLLHRLFRDRLPANSRVFQLRVGGEAGYKARMIGKN